DPFGIKPLFLGKAGEDLVFGSEIRAVREGGVVPATLNPAAVDSVLAYGAVIEPSTIAIEIVAVPPGHVVTVDAGGRIGAPRRVWPARTRSCDWTARSSAASFPLRWRPWTSPRSTA